MEYVGQRMIVDMTHADGSVTFEKEYMEFNSRNYNDIDARRVIYYKDITDVRGFKGIKSTVCIDAEGKTYKFYMYKMNTFIQFVEEARKNWNVVEAEVVSEQKPVVNKEPLTDAQLDKLAKLADLHKQGVLSDAQFEEEKNLILNR